MGCRISVFDNSQQRNATKNNEKSAVSCKSRKLGVSSPAPPNVLLGFAKKLILLHGEKPVVKVKEEHPPSCQKLKNDYLIPSLEDTKEAAAAAADHAIGFGATTLRKLGGGGQRENVVEAEEAKISTKDEAAKFGSETETDDNNADNNNNNNTINGGGLEARISDYDGPLWIASPSFREYCIVDSDSEDEDSFFKFKGNCSREREKMENNIIHRATYKVAIPDKVTQDNCVVRQTSTTTTAGPVKKRRLMTLGKVLTMHKPKPAAVKNLFYIKKCSTCSNGHGPAHSHH